MKNEVLKIDLVYDIICPWCYIGHHRLINAIQKNSAKVLINLIPYQIQPNLPIDGVSVETYWRNKGITDVKAAYKNVIQAGEEEGLSIDPTKFSRIPNTLKIHQVILKAEEKGVGVEVLHAIQTAYFTKGVDISLVQNISKEVQLYLSESEVKLAWEDESVYKDKVIVREQKAKDLYINSVPTFLIADKHRIKGAVSNYKLTDMLQQLAPQNEIGDFCDITSGIC